jgi:hypothetical protein
MNRNHFYTKPFILHFTYVKNCPSFLEDQTHSALDLFRKFILNQFATVPKYLTHYYCFHIYLSLNYSLPSLLSHKERVVD